MENFWALACGDSDLYDDIDWCSGWHSPEHSAKKPWPLFPRRKSQKKTWGWGWSSELGYPRESPEAAAHLCVGGSKVWALSDVCSTVIICFKLFSWENNKIIICLSRQIHWASVGWDLQVSCSSASVSILLALHVHLLTCLYSLPPLLLAIQMCCHSRISGLTVGNKAWISATCL